MGLLRKDYTAQAWAIQDAIDAHRAHGSLERTRDDILKALDRMYINKAQFLTHVLRLVATDDHDRAKKLAAALEGRATTRLGVVVYGGTAILLVLGIIGAIVYAVVKVIFWL